MAFIGFLTMLAMGGGLVAGGLFAIYAAAAVGSVHRGDRVFGWMLLAVGAMLLYLALDNAPFTIEIHSAALAAQGGV